MFAEREQATTRCCYGAIQGRTQRTCELRRTGDTLHLRRREPAHYAESAVTETYESKVSDRTI